MRRGNCTSDYGSVTSLLPIIRRVKFPMFKVIDGADGRVSVQQLDSKECPLCKRDTWEGVTHSQDLCDEELVRNIMLS